MTIIRAQIVLHTVDGLAENFVTNTIYIDSSNVGTAPTEGTGHIQTFYRSLSTQFSEAIAQTGHEIKWYVQDQPSPNFPYEETTFSFSSALNSPGLPSECAIVTSFQAAKSNGVSQASRRGRLYIGPLITTANLNGRPNPGSVTTIVDATKQLALDISTMAAADGQTRWVVWSQKLQSHSDIEDGWVDNAFDTQRRRGLPRTSRTRWDINE